MKRESLLSWRLRGVSAMTNVMAWRCTLPISVASPTAVTFITPRPSTTMVERKATFFAYVDDDSFPGSTDFDTGGSPVRLDSSICSDTASKSTPSAGTSSPWPSITMSPTTTSERDISVTFPPRTTLTVVSLPMALSSSKRRAASFSK